MKNSSPSFFLSLYGWTYWFPILLAGLILTIVFFVIPGAAWLALLIALFTVACLAFFRDLPRKVPQEPHLMVAPADGTVTEVSKVDYYPPFNGAAHKVSIFLSVLDVHVNRAPCTSAVLWTRYEEGLFLDARNPTSSARNQSNTICLAATPGGHPIAAVKQIVGAIARRIIAPLSPGQHLERGQRFGMIAFGSRTELYVPTNSNWQPIVSEGSEVQAGKSILFRWNV